MKAVIRRYFNVPFLAIVLILILLITHCSCNMKTGNTVQIRVPLIHYTIKLHGNKHKIVYGHSYKPLKNKNQ